MLTAAYRLSKLDTPQLSGSLLVPTSLAHTLWPPIPLQHVESIPPCITLLGFFSDSPVGHIPQAGSAPVLLNAGTSSASVRTSVQHALAVLPYTSEGWSSPGA